MRRLHSLAWDHPLVGPDVLLEHHLPGIRTLDLEILGRVSLELSFDLWREIGNPAHAAFLPYLPMRHRPRECSRSATQDGKNCLRLAGHGSQIREA
jgi:hypothetical protein